MYRFACRFNIAASLMLGFVAGVPCTSTAWAQSGAATDHGDSHVAVVSGSEVYIRCGSGESYYPFGKINDGDFVKVVGEKYGWSRVAAQGPAFRDMFGYIRYAKGDTSRFRLASDGKSGVTLGKTDVIAPNMDARNALGESWKALVRLDADQTLRVLEVTEFEKETVLKVVLPPSAQGWISTAYLKKASDAEAAQFNQMLKKPTERLETSAPLPPSAADESPTIEPVVKPAPAPSVQPVLTAPATPATIESDSTPTPEPAIEAITSSQTQPASETTFTPTMSAAPAATPAMTREPTLKDLEAAFTLLQKEPIATAEVAPLRAMYMDVAAKNVSNARITRFITARVEQLNVWEGLQKKRNELDAVRNRMKMSADEAEAVRKALESSAEYAAVGRVAASTIYDGEALPKLLRVQDASTGRTLAYLRPDEKYEAVNLIGNLVGIVGEKIYDGTLRLNIIEPARIDLLMPEQR